MFACRIKMSHIKYWMSLRRHENKISHNLDHVFYDWLCCACFMCDRLGSVYSVTVPWSQYLSWAETPYLVTTCNHQLQPSSLLIINIAIVWILRGLWVMSQCTSQSNITLQFPWMFAFQSISNFYRSNINCNNSDQWPGW